MCQSKAKKTALDTKYRCSQCKGTGTITINSWCSNSYSPCADCDASGLAAGRYMPDGAPDHKTKSDRLEHSIYITGNEQLAWTQDVLVKFKIACANKQLEGTRAAMHRGVVRTARWLRNENFFNDAPNSLIAVGYSHLYGSEGLITLLRANGWKIEHYAVPS